MSVGECEGNPLSSCVKLLGVFPRTVKWEQRVRLLWDSALQGAETRQDGWGGVIGKMPNFFLRFPVFNYKEFSYAGAKKKKKKSEKKEWSEKERILCTGTKKLPFLRVGANGQR